MTKFIEALTGLVSSKIDTYKALALMFKLETQLAAMSVSPLLLTLVMLFVVLLSLWLGVMGLSLVLLFNYFHSLIVALLILISVTLIVSFCLYRSLISNLRKMSFEKTREYFSENKTENYHDATPTNLYPTEPTQQRVET